MADFLKQIEQPLFPEILWSKPLNKKAAKSLLIIGGHKNRLNTVQAAYMAAKSAGIGEVKLILPDALTKQLKGSAGVMFAASTKSGSFSVAATEEVLAAVDALDGILLGGDFSNNTETVSFVEQIITGVNKPLVLGAEALDLMLFNLNALKSKRSLLIIDIKLLFKLIEQLNLAVEISKSSSILNSLELIEMVQKNMGSDMVVYKEGEIFVAADNKLSVTYGSYSNQNLHGGLATFWLQHPEPFKALTAGCWWLIKN